MAGFAGVSQEASLYLSPPRHGADHSIVRAAPRRCPGVTSDNASYGAHGLALFNEMRTWGVVRQAGVPGTGIIGTGCETRFCVFSQEDSPLRYTTSLYIQALAASKWDFCLTTDDFPFLMPCGRYGVVPRHDLPALYRILRCWGCSSIEHH